MKRRVIKKNINRYITPLIKGMTKTNGVGWEIDHGNGLMEWIEGQNHSIKNGDIIPEGTIVPRHVITRDPITAIKKARETILELMQSHRYVYLRIPPEYRHGRLYMRIITEKVK